MRVSTAGVEEGSVVEVTPEGEEASVGMVTAEAAGEMESASAERASQLEIRSLGAEDPAPLHLRRVHQIGSLSLPVQPADRYFVRSRAKQRLIVNKIILRLPAIVQHKLRVLRSQGRLISGF